MKSRELLTTPVLIVTNYTIVPNGAGKFLHSFTPETTNTIYQFVANQEPVLESGQHYNIGYTVDSGINWVDIAATAKADAVDKDTSFYVAKILGKEASTVETKKSDERVVHQAKDGHYLGKKYAWRIYGMAIAREAFETYLSDIKHPSTPCFTEGSSSIAYKEDGLASAIDALRISVVRKSRNRFSSPLMPSKDWFNVKGVSAITDKK